MPANTKINKIQYDRQTTGVSNCYGCKNFTSQGEILMYCTVFQCEYKDPQMFDYVFRNLCKGNRASY
jgi:hypothetical protein